MQCAILKLEVGSEHGPNGPPYQSDLTVVLKCSLYMQVHTAYSVKLNTSASVFRGKLCRVQHTCTYVHYTYCRRTGEDGCSSGEGQSKVPGHHC